MDWGPYLQRQQYHASICVIDEELEAGIRGASGTDGGLAKSSGVRANVCLLSMSARSGDSGPADTLAWFRLSTDNVG